MKSNLARFANFMADQLGLSDWIVEPNEEARGGRVVVVEGDFLRDLTPHREFLDDIRRSGNAPIDCLYCVPPTLVEREGPTRRSAVARVLRAHGEAVWDGASGDERQDIPRDNQAPRVVQYRSCRGLEAWSVICLNIDESFEIEHRQASPDRQASTPDTSEGVRRHASRWMMIPLSRPMDTLVLNLKEPSSDLGRVLRKAERRYPDFVQWVGDVR